MIELFASGAVVLFLDQWSKRGVEVQLTDRRIGREPVLRIRRVTSRKTGYERDGARALLVLVWLAALACAILLHRTGAGFQSQAAFLGLGSALAVAFWPRV